MVAPNLRNGSIDPHRQHGCHLSTASVVLLAAAHFVRADCAQRVGGGNAHWLTVALCVALGAVATDGVGAAGCHHHRPGIKAVFALIVTLATVVADSAPIKEAVTVLAETFALAAIIAAAAAEHITVSVARVVARCATGQVRGTARPATSVDSSIHAPMALSAEVRADAARVPVGAGAAFALVLVAEQFTRAARLDIPRIVDTAAFAGLAVPSVAKLLARAALVVSHP